MVRLGGRVKQQGCRLVRRKWETFLVFGTGEVW